MRNATTDSPSPVCNNPFAKYNGPQHPASNLHTSLWQLARASIATPTYFPPETLVRGMSAGENLGLTAKEMNLLYNATNIPSALMSAALNEQDFLCRVFGQCVAGAPLDLEIGDMIDSNGPFSNKAFRFVRYNADLTEAGLSKIGCSDLVPERVSTA